VAKAIEKLPADRFETAKQFTEALDDAAFTYQPAPRETSAAASAPPITQPVSAPMASVGPTKLVRGMAAAIVVFAGLAAWGWLKPAPEAVRPVATRALIDIGDRPVANVAKVIISPDGSHLAYVWGNSAADRELRVRRLDEERFRVLYPDDAFWPAFSPDGEWIVFEAASNVMKIALSGGAPQLVARTAGESPREFHWGDDGTIVFVSGGSLYTVSENGGEPALLEGPPGDVDSPHLLPGGRGLLFSSVSTFTTYYLDLETDSVMAIVPGGIAPRYVETGHLLYIDENGGLWARPFDPETGQVGREATPVLQGITRRIEFVAKYDISQTGTLVYGVGGSGGGANSQVELVVVRLADGSEEVAPLPPRVMEQVRWAPDGARVAYSGTEPGQASTAPMIYEYNVELQTAPRRLTSEGAINYYPTWSPDGDRIAFSSQRAGLSGRDMYIKNVFDDTPPELVMSRPGSRSRPGQWLEEDLVVLTWGNSPTLNNSWTIQIPDTSTARAYIPAEGNRQHARVAPQRDLAAYESDETGQYEIFVRSFPEPRQPTPVSNGGGRHPRWSPDGNTIYYWRAYQGADSLFAARVQRDPVYGVRARGRLP
jgi:serine/threonine-protein kinase